MQTSREKESTNTPPRLLRYPYNIKSLHFALNWKKYICIFSFATPLIKWKKNETELEASYCKTSLLYVGISKWQNLLENHENTQATVVRKFSVALVVLRRGCFSRSKQTDDGSVHQTNMKWTLQAVQIFWRVGFHSNSLKRIFN